MTQINETFAMDRESLVTNGLGGYSFEGYQGRQTRKYHGFYTISLKPPIKRMHVIGKLALTLWDQGVGHCLNANQTQAGQSLVDYGYKTSFDGVLKESYFYKDLEIHFERCFLHQTNALHTKLRVRGEGDYTISLTPWWHVRDHHDVADIAPEAYTLVTHENHLVFKHPHVPEIYVFSKAKWTPDFQVSDLNVYPIETRRGYKDAEKHLSLGSYTLAYKGQETTCDIQVTTDFESYDTHEVFAGERARMAALCSVTGFENPDLKQLVMASDQFIVKRESTKKHTVIAGYPWFTDWGRDTMIALPGLCLTTGRHDLAHEIIDTFLAYTKEGIIPNNFPDDDCEPMYNTADATLWLFVAIYHYEQATGDLEALKAWYPQLKNIIKHHIEGTINAIYVDQDDLLWTGTQETQLTWMDVKVDGWVVTPRHGKAIEINALFYNALCIMDMYSQQFSDSMDYGNRAMRMKRAFNDAFWDQEEQKICDVIQGDTKDYSIRPNALFSISLPYPILSKDRWQSVVDQAKEDLYFGTGLRSLSPKDPHYHGRYQGDLLARDSAYHRGTGWGWLLGPYFEAHYKTYRDKAYIHQELSNLLDHTKVGALGSYSENFEGDAPHGHRGCPAQAWSVAEVLRIAKWIQYR